MVEQTLMGQQLWSSACSLFVNSSTPHHHDQTVITGTLDHHIQSPASQQPTNLDSPCTSVFSLQNCLAVMSSCFSFFFLPVCSMQSSAICMHTQRPRKAVTCIAVHTGFNIVTACIMFVMITAATCNFATSGLGSLPLACYLC